MSKTLNVLCRSCNHSVKVPYKPKNKSRKDNMFMRFVENTHLPEHYNKQGKVCYKPKKKK